MKTNYHKQKYFCQICSRQCQDKDGFTCHLKSKTHEKNMEAIAKHPDLYINSYSQEFEKGFLDIMKRLYQNQWVSANRVYEEYMHEKDSVPLNMTKWESLNKLILHLTHSNKCKINPSDNDIHLKYIDNTIIKGSAKKAMCNDIKNKEIEEIAKHKIIQPEIKKEYSKVNIEDRKGIEIQLKEDKVLLNSKREREHEGNKGSKDKGESKNNSDEDEIWICKGLVVSIEDKELEKGKYYKEKAVILNNNDYIAEVKILKANTRISIDQFYLNNIIPSLESPIYLIRGKHKFNPGILKSINKDKGTALIELNNNKETIKVPYNNICKYDNSI